MKRILINATHAEEIRVALCNGNHLYDFDLENRTREQKKANIYKGHVTRVEPSLEAVFVEYGSQRQGFLPIREIAPEYLAGDPRSTNNIKQLIKEGDELIVQVEKEERGNKGAALSTLISLAGRYLVLMPNNARGGGISRQISGKLRDEMKQALSELRLPKGMSVIIRTAGIGKTTDELQHDLDHLLNIWKGIQQQSQKFPSPRLLHQEAGVVTRAVRDYLRDDITEIWVDNEYAYNEAANFIEAVMPQQANKLRKYTDYEPMFARFGIEKQIETAYQREVRLPSGGSIVIDQTEALVSIDINSSKATKGADVSETAFNTNLEAADEIARQLRLRDMGGLIVIDFIDMATDDHQKQVENRLKEATKNDRARIQFAEISRFGLLEMSRQRLRPSLEEATGYLCPRCHGTGMIRDLRSLALSIMRQIEQRALQERHGEIQAEVPTDIAAFLLNEKRETLVCLEQESGTRITILPHAHLESPEFNITYNSDGFAPSSYERVAESQQQEYKDRGYDTSNWHTDDNEVSRVAPTGNHNAWSSASNAVNTTPNPATPSNKPQQTANNTTAAKAAAPQPVQPAATVPATSAVAWLSNLFAPTQQAQVTPHFSGQDAASAIESLVNTGAQSLGVQGQINHAALTASIPAVSANTSETSANPYQEAPQQPLATAESSDKDAERRKRGNRKPKAKKPNRYQSETSEAEVSSQDIDSNKDKSNDASKTAKTSELPKREPNSRRDSRGVKERRATLANDDSSPAVNEVTATDTAVTPVDGRKNNQSKADRPKGTKQRDPNSVQVQVFKTEPQQPIAAVETTHLSLDASKGEIAKPEVQPIASTTMPEPTTPEQAIQTPVNPSSVTVSNDEVTELSTVSTPSASSAELAVTPSQGRAKNDPREVYKAYQAQFSPVASVVSTSVTKISGTVSQFINQYLDNAAEKMATDSVVSCFIQAIDAFNHQAATTTPSKDNVVVAEQQRFGQYFRNYGYASLSAQNLDDYHTAILPASQFQRQAGKTDAALPAVTKRAINDPRGSSVKTAIAQAPTDSTPSVTEPNSETDSVTGQVEAASTQSASLSQNHLSYQAGSVGAWIVARLGEQGHALIEQGKLVEAYLQAHNAPVASRPTETVYATTIADDAIVNQDVDSVPTADEPAVAFNTDSEGVEATHVEDSAEAAAQKRKTTPVSYKNMIESVAEQMKPATVGMLTLATPKAPKTRTRKAKASEKPAAKPKTRTSKKVENAVVVTKKSTTTAQTDVAPSHDESVTPQPNQ
ncbi:Rne/Rng family ribonuclease [Moraxella osloensis]|uniref:Ribonuclease E n=1 Tax=Faucicola osloensis TaxID=34062 RepID=A0A6P1KD02_FAUOS|nr:Rne/Rng family ribonuclease [Moraxella osloensis]QHG10009.1 Rne/Rng family ribonuclease [Moraxella osloensis]